jgi:hypothetical protein
VKATMTEAVSCTRIASLSPVCPAGVDVGLPSYADRVGHRSES